MIREALRADSPVIRSMAVRILGRRGEVSRDLSRVKIALRDPASQVRAAAMVAVRELGKEGLDVLAVALGRERVAVIWKMIIHTFVVWRDKKAGGDLYRHLR